MAYHCAMIEQLEGAARMVAAIDPDEGSDVRGLAACIHIHLLLVSLTWCCHSSLRRCWSSMRDSSSQLHIHVSLSYPTRRMQTYCLPGTTSCTNAATSFSSASHAECCMPL